MKRVLYLLAIFALLLSCDKGADIEVPNEKPTPTPESTVITSIEARIDNTTRATTIVSTSNSVQSYWGEDDKIMITDMNRLAVFTIADGAGSVNAKFSGKLENSKTPLYGGYPSSAVKVLNDALHFTIPVEQSYTPVRGTDLGDKMPLFGTSTDGKSFVFAAVTSAVRFDITVPEQCAIKSVTMSADKTNIAGLGKVTPATPYVTAPTKSSITLTYVHQPKGTSTDGWATIASVDFKNSSDRVLYDVETTDGVFTFCYTPDVEFKVGSAQTIKLSVEEFVQVESREELKQGEFYSSKGVPDEEESYEPGSIAKGTVKYHDGTPAVGVSISDGFSIVQTDSKGCFSLTPHQDAWYIYYSLPADCATIVNDKGQPNFYIKYDPNRFEYNFTLTKSTKDSKFSLFCLADPQCSNSSGRSRFQKESVPHIKALAESKGVPCYGVTLGDIVSSGDSSDTTPQMPYMREHMSITNTGIPIYQTMGNHDYLYFNGSAPIEADETSSTYNIKAQRLFEDIFGPINHSWNRSDAHIVCMRDMLWNSNSKGGDYSLGFSDEQYEWLKQDLSFVPKDKLVILCVHIPLVNSTNKNVQKVIALLAAYNEAHIMAGHTHYTRNEPTLSSGVYEHVHGAVCGAWWHANTNGDGTPNGYGVYDIEGNKITNWYYQGVNTGMNDRDYQIRLYRGNHLSGGKYEYFAQQHGDDVLLANIFNADDSWTVKVYEDGVYSGQMTKIPYKKETPTKGTGIDNPTKPSTASSQDWWSVGYLVGVKNRSRSSYFTSCFHLYKYKLKNKNAAIRVEAIDRFGRVYYADTIIEDYDYSLMNR